MFYGVLWCSMMFYDVLCLKSILGFLLSERTSGVSPVIFDLVQSHQLKSWVLLKLVTHKSANCFIKPKRLLKFWTDSIPWVGFASGNVLTIIFLVQVKLFSTKHFMRGKKERAILQFHSTNLNIELVISG